jgi:hypothetical protein
MAIGPGKYDDLCTEVREKSKAKGAIVIIFDGEKGGGFSCQVPLSIQMIIPKLLRDVADNIERSGYNA